MKAGKTFSTPGNQYCATPMNAIQLLATKNASNRWRQYDWRSRTTHETTITGTSRRKSRNSFSIWSQGASPGIKGHHANTQKGMSSQSHQGSDKRLFETNSRCAKMQARSNQIRISEG